VPPERVHQFVAELEKLIAANLAHPGIAGPIAAGITGVSAYLAQEFAEADSLDVVVRDYGPAPPPDAIRIATELAGALDFAAVVNVNHGALHPRDVLIAADDVRLTGLGIGPALERIGVAVPVRRPYTAPERLPGGRWNRRADLFSLAAVMFELLFGRRVTGTGEQAREAVGEIVGANVRQLRAVFARALAEDPADRFDTALEFAEQLKGAFSDAALTFVPRTEPVAPAVDAVSSQPVARELDERVAPAERMIAVPPASAPTDAAVAQDFELRAAEAERYDRVESTPSVTPTVIPSTALPPPVGAGFSRPEERFSWPADEIQRAPLPHKRSRFGAIAAALLLGAVIGAFASGLLRNRSVPVAQMTGAPPPVAASAPQRAETIPPDPPLPVPSTGSTQTSAARDAAVGPGASPQSEHRDTNGRASGAAPAPRPTAPDAHPATTAPEEPGRLLVRSTPAGARVFVDGREVGPTPQTVRDLPPGTHLVRIVRDGYTTEERRVAITAAQPAQSISVELARPPAAVDRVATAPAPSTPATVGRFMGALVVDSRPSGARVFVDGKAAGTTPLEVGSVDAGSHALRLELDGYQRWTSAIRVVAGERNRVTASLER
jgi:eukaryotic-like serine/threonine-protein kinase